MLFTFGFCWRRRRTRGLSCTNEAANVRRQDSYKSEVNISLVCMTGGSTSVAGVGWKCDLVRGSITS
jgi:hypothetical protein